MAGLNQQDETSPRRLRAFILTSDDKTFLPYFYDQVFAGRRDSIVGVAIVQDPNFRKFLKNSFLFMGLRTFTGEVIRQVVLRVRNLFYSIFWRSKIRSIKSVCQKYNIHYTQVENVNTRRFREYLLEKDVNLIISVACPQILKRKILELPSYGCINIHYGLLPEYRGMYPSFWVLANNEKETGVTIHYMAEKIDAGEILVQLRESILPEDSFYTLVKRLKTTIGPEALIQAIDKIKSGSEDLVKNEYAKGSYYSFPTKEAMKRLKANGRKWF